MDEDWCIRLDNQICFPLYAAAKEITRKYKQLLDELDLTYTQYIVMLVLWEKERISMHELCQQVYLDSGTLTPLLVKLEKKGLVVREVNNEDERRREIHATPKGIGLKAQARKIPAQIGNCLGISTREAIELKRILMKILANSE